MFQKIKGFILSPQLDRLPQLFGFWAVFLEHHRF